MSWALPSPALPMAMFTATGDSARPMEMITGAMTTGGSKRSMKPGPFRRTAKPSTMYTSPAAITPPMTAGRPNSPLAAMIGAMKAKLDARNTGT